MYRENQCVPPTEQDLSGTATIIITTTNASWGTFGKWHSAPPVDENSWLPGIHSQKHTQWKTLIQKKTRTPALIVALFTIAKTSEQAKCPLTDKWIKKTQCVCTLHIYIYEYYSVIKTSNNVICSNMDRPRDCFISLSECTVYTSFPQEKMVSRRRLWESNVVLRPCGLKTWLNPVKASV